MGGQHADVDSPCPACSATAHVGVGASVQDGELRFYESTRCPGCGLAEEADGFGLSDFTRWALCAEHGRWSAHVRDLGPDHARALLALRTFLELTPAETLRVVREARPIVEGALVEIEYAQFVLEPAGVALAVVRVAD
jgi:hypothetical protein